MALIAVHFENWCPDVVGMLRDVSEPYGKTHH